jgi:hypothetical protein
MATLRIPADVAQFLAELEADPQQPVIRPPVIVESRGIRPAIAISDPVAPARQRNAKLRQVLARQTTPAPILRLDGSSADDQLRESMSEGATAVLWGEASCVPRRWETRVAHNDHDQLSLPSHPLPPRVPGARKDDRANIHGRFREIARVQHQLEAFPVLDSEGMLFRDIGRRLPPDSKSSQMSVSEQK